jgi:uncharacterized protein
MFKEKIGKSKMASKHRILSIDGGGIMGVFPAAFLATIEETTGKSIIDHFDLIVGTSTGGIIALGLGLGLSAREILEIYEELGDSVFGGIHWLKSISYWLFSKHSQTKLKLALEKSFQQRKLGDSKIRLVIPSMNIDTGEIHLFKTSHHSTLEIDYEKTAVEVALATSAAPSFFPTYISSNSLAMVDGGMWANNPTFIGIVEAITKLNWDAASLSVLSLGCTTTPVNFKLARLFGLGKLYWAKNSIDLFLSGQSCSALGMTRQFIGASNLLRISPMVSNGRFNLDGVKEINELKGMGSNEARRNLLKVREIFLNQSVERFQPHHQL